MELRLRYSTFTDGDVQRSASALVALRKCRPTYDFRVALATSGGESHLTLLQRTIAESDVPHLVGQRHESIAVAAIQLTTVASPTTVASMAFLWRNKGPARPYISVQTATKSTLGLLHTLRPLG